MVALIGKIMAPVPRGQTGEREEKSKNKSDTPNLRFSKDNVENGRVPVYDRWG